MKQALEKMADEAVNLSLLMTIIYLFEATAGPFEIVPK